MININVIERAKNGDRNAFVLIYKTYRSRVYSTAYFILKDYQHSEDVVQETFLQTYLNVHKLKELEAFEVWLYKITVNNCFKILKKNRKKHIVELNENIDKIDLDELSVPETIIIENELKTKIMECVYSLDDKHRVVLTLFYFNNLAIKDIADIISCSEGTVKSRLFYGKKVLRKLFDKEYNGNLKNSEGGIVYEP